MNKKILIIEDNPGIQMSLTDELEAEGYRVFASGNGTDGLKLVQDKDPDLIILDIKMPAGGGLSVFENLRMSTNTMTIPVIFITAYPSEDIREKVMEMGAVDFITKPFDSDDLMGKVKKALGVEG